MTDIRASIFSIYKVGPGPSSSHTLGPMSAAAAFRRRVVLPETAARLRVILYGSLSSTGEGHGTPYAVLAGLGGYEPSACPPALLSQLAAAGDLRYPVMIAERTFSCGLDDIIFGGDIPELPHPNTLDFEILDATGNVLCRYRCTSPGGGEYTFDGEPSKPVSAGVLPYPYHNLRSFQAHLKQTGCSPIELLYANECALTGLSRDDIDVRLDQILAVMAGVVSRGLKAEGLLPGPLRVVRKAGTLYRIAQEAELPEIERHGLLLNAYAYAASEENADGHQIVTAPTAGASGVIPALLTLLRECYQATPMQLREGLMVAALFGLSARHNASISGAEVGCQGEVGVATAMGAALLAQVRGLSFGAVANAAEIGLEHQLGMTCDPIGGYVQIPCIERNALGTAKAFAAFLLSRCNPDWQKLDYDAVVQVMLETGRDMHSRYKETSTGGLAHCARRP